jgi:hypothetical protein
MFGKAITYKTTTKCLVDNRTAKYEASVGPAENLPPSVRRISKTLNKLRHDFIESGKIYENKKHTLLYYIYSTDENSDYP